MLDRIDHTGVAVDDLAKVTTIARSMVYEYGMGTKIRSHQVPSDDYTVSESLRQTRDEEVQEIAEEAYRGAHRLLTDHRDLLDEIANKLLDNEVIEHEEIVEIMAGHRDSALAPKPRFEPRKRPRQGRVAAALRSTGEPQARSRSKPPPAAGPKG